MTDSENPKWEDIGARIDHTLRAGSVTPGEEVEVVRLHSCLALWIVGRQSDATGVLSGNLIPDFEWFTVEIRPMTA